LLNRVRLSYRDSRVQLRVTSAVSRQLLEDADSFLTRCGSDAIMCSRNFSILDLIFHPIFPGSIHKHLTCPFSDSRAFHFDVDANCLIRREASYGLNCAMLAQLSWDALDQGQKACPQTLCDRAVLRTSALSWQPRYFRALCDIGCRRNERKSSRRGASLDAEL